MLAWVRENPAMADVLNDPALAPFLEAFERDEKALTSVHKQSWDLSKTIWPDNGKPTNLPTLKKRIAESDLLLAKTSGIVAGTLEFLELQ